MNILLTGGTGYIGSHTAVALAGEGHNITIIDNYVNSNKDVLERIEKIVKKKLKIIKATSEIRLY